jgi:hypothetical protein
MRGSVEEEGYIRNGWWSTDFAVEQVVRFERRFGDETYQLLLHAALPLSLTPELLNVLRVHFLRDVNVPVVTEADVWLSRLTVPYDQAVCRLEPRAREVLLVDMKRRFGWQHMLDLARFLDGYQRARGGSAGGDRLSVEERWVVQAYLAPDQVVREMAAALQETLRQDSGEALGMQLLLVHAVELVLGPLEDTTHLRDELHALVRSARQLAAELYKADGME